MKFGLFVTIAAALFAVAVYLFVSSSDLLLERDYLAGILHVISGLALSKAGLEVARLAVLTPRG